MSPSPPPARDITRGTEQDVLYYDFHHVRHVSADKALQIVVKTHKHKADWLEEEEEEGSDCWLLKFTFTL